MFAETAVCVCVCETQIVEKAKIENTTGKMNFSKRVTWKLLKMFWLMISRDKKGLINNGFK